MTTGTIIIINGASSSGKSSILRALQDMLPDPFLDAGIDKFIWMLPTRYLDRPLWDDVLGLASIAGQTGRQLISGMHLAIAALAQAGNNVLADHVLVEAHWLQECADLFCNLPAYFVGVRCPLDVLIEREKSRRDRTLGQARAQFDIVHAHDLYDLEVHTNLFSPQECANQIMQRIESKASPSAFKKLQIRLRACNKPEG